MSLVRLSLTSVPACVSVGWLTDCVCLCVCERVCICVGKALLRQLNVWLILKLTIEQLFFKVPVWYWCDYWYVLLMICFGIHTYIRDTPTWWKKTYTYNYFYKTHFILLHCCIFVYFFSFSAHMHAHTCTADICIQLA